MLAQACKLDVRQYVMKNQTNIGENKMLKALWVVFTDAMGGFTLPLLPFVILVVIHAYTFQ
jgi:hypothetical protein